MDGSMFNGVGRMLAVLCVVVMLTFGGFVWGTTYLIMKANAGDHAAEAKQKIETSCAKAHLVCDIKATK